MSFLRDDVGNTFFSPQGKAKYDGLLVCVSGHGIRGHVVTSNLEHVDKTRISRCIYDRFPKFIDIPRIFIFDACAGARERREHISMDRALDIETEGAFEGDDAEGQTGDTRDIGKGGIESDRDIGGGGNMFVTYLASDF